ncbi:MAG: hypothetical protein AAGA56_13880 [Myxococcota bacterium]
MRHCVFAAALMAATSSAGCDHKIAQCNRLIDTMNKEQAGIQNIKLGGGADAKAEESAEELVKLAEVLDRISGQVKAVELQDEQLVQHQAKYVDMATNLAKTVRDTAKAMEEHDREKAEAGAEAINKFKEPERELVNTINQYCGGS